MSEQTYTFSFYTKERIPVLEGKKFWRFWVNQKIGWKEEWVRKSFSGLSEAEAKFIMGNMNNAVAMSFIQRFTETRMWQLELNPVATEYVATNFILQQEEIENERRTRETP